VFDEPVQLIAFGETVDFSVPVLVETARDIIRDPDVQRGAMFIGEDVYPVVVIAHASRNNQRCFASLNMTSPSRVFAVILSEAKNLRLFPRNVKNNSQRCSLRST
jgi:hypothetical protein